jgi:hypothetical protein
MAGAPAYVETFTAVKRNLAKIHSGTAKTNGRNALMYTKSGGTMDAHDLRRQFSIVVGQVARLCPTR